MTYLLDTDICIYIMEGRNRHVARKWLSIPSSAIALSAVTAAEMYSGAARSDHPVRSRERQEDFFEQFLILPFDEAAAKVYGQIDGFLKRSGVTIGPMDTQIAAIALTRNLTLVTHNTRHFSRVPELAIEDWAVA